MSPASVFCDSIDVSTKFAQDLGDKLKIEDEFSFVSGNSGASLASADELFLNGQIRRQFPLVVEECGGASSLRPPLKRIFVGSSSSSEEDSETEEWARSPPATEVTKQSCKKSYSTGFSRLWKFRDLKLRRNSEGEDAFVFLNPAASAKKSAAKVKATATAPEKANSGEGKNRVMRKSKTTSSWAPEKHYAKKGNANGKRRSYLPYRQNLVGFFTNVSGLSRNVHPF